MIQIAWLDDSSIEIIIILKDGNFRSNHILGEVDTVIMNSRPYVKTFLWKTRLRTSISQEGKLGPQRLTEEASQNIGRRKRELQPRARQYRSRITTALKQLSRTCGSRPPSPFQNFVASLPLASALKKFTLSPPSSYSSVP